MRVISLNSKSDAILLKNVAGTFVIKGLAILVSFFSTTAYIKYFHDSEVLGVWFTLLSILQWILTFDFGIGNGLRNKIVPFLDFTNEDDTLNLKKYISSGYISITVLSIFVSAIGGGLLYLGNWNKWLNVPQSTLDSSVLKLAVLITFLGIIVQFVIKVITSILYALRMNIIVGSTTLISNILLCLFLIIPHGGDSATKLVYLSVAYAVTIIFPLIVVTWYVFVKKLPGCSPKVKFYDRGIAKEVLSLGGWFFVIQLELLLLVSTDSWIISFLFSSKEVVAYQVYYKLFSLPTTIFALISQPLWSSYSVAKENGEFQWIMKKNKLVNLLAIAVSVGCIVECIISPWLINIWVGADNCEINTAAAIAFCVLSIGQLFMYASTSLANGIGKLKCQAVCNSIAVLIKFTMTFWMAKVTNDWSSVVFVECIGTFLVVIAQPICNRVNINRLQRLKEI